MKILHTSDWHLGKSLMGYSRIDEQKQFIEELTALCDQQQIDLVLIAGDIYDTVNPSAEAEKLFYSAVRTLSDDGKRPILLVSGNHDSPNRLTAATPIATELGILMVGTPRTVVPLFQGSHFAVVDAGEGYVEIEIGDERAVILTMPYPNEKNLNEIISEELTDKEFQKTYSEKIGAILKETSTRFRADTVNLVVGHFFVRGGELSGSELDIQLGGAYAVHASAFPTNADYIAMGHLHRPQKIGGTIPHAYYSGSPIQYSKSEIHYAKCVYIAELHAGCEAVVTKHYLKNSKPIEIWKADNVLHALALCEENKDKECWVFLEIKTDTSISMTDMRQMRGLKKDIVEIMPIISGHDEEEALRMDTEKSIGDEFKAFYLSRKSVEATDEMTELFLKILNDFLGGDENATS